MLAARNQPGTVQHEATRSSIFSASHVPTGITATRSKSRWLQHHMRRAIDPVTEQAAERLRPMCFVFGVMLTAATHDQSGEFLLAPILVCIRPPF